MDNFREVAGQYVTDLEVALVRARRVAWLVALGWVMFPIALATLLRPGDVIYAQYKFQGMTPPEFYTAQQLSAGFIEAVFLLGVLALMQIVGTVLFYRFAQITDGDTVATPALWPCAALLPGVIGNALWFVCLGYVDVTGIILGLGPIALTYLCERLCEHLSRDFVFGPALAGQHP